MCWRRGLSSHSQNILAGAHRSVDRSFAFITLLPPCGTWRLSGAAFAIFAAGLPTDREVASAEPLLLAT